MKLKLDENLPRDLADELAARGLDVDTVLDEGLGGTADEAVVGAATAAVPDAADLGPRRG